MQGKIHEHSTSARFQFVSIDHYCAVSRLNRQHFSLTHIGSSIETHAWAMWSLLFVTLMLFTLPNNGGAQRILLREAPPVTIRRQGVVSGVEVTLPKIGQRAYVYLGLPFAQPPVGNLRFAPPDVDPPPAWSGIRNGSVHMPSCMQDPQMLHNRNRVFEALMPNSQIRVSEDCLYLNVYRPEGKVLNDFMHNKESRVFLRVTRLFL